MQAEQPGREEAPAENGKLDDSPVGVLPGSQDPRTRDPDSENPQLLTPWPALSKHSADDIESLRSEAWTLAARLAERNGLGELIFALPEQGMGFLLCDVPDPELAETLDQEMLGQVSTLWWQLAACAEITVAPVDILIQISEAGRGAAPGTGSARRGPAV